MTRNQIVENGITIPLHKCVKPDCFRQVKEGIVYCCTPCTLAAAGKYEIHEHSEWCEERHAERREWPWR